MSQLANYIERNLFDAGGHTGNIYYFRIVRRINGYVWNPTTELLVDDTSVSWTSTITILEEVGQTGKFPIRIQKELPPGTYDVVVYKQLGSEPANTDDIEKQFEFKHGSIFGF